MEFFFLIWNEVIIRPMLNTLMVFYVVCFNNMGLAIIAFTILVRLVTLPLTLKQIRQMRRMSELQPRCGRSRNATAATGRGFPRKP